VKDCSTMTDAEFLQYAFMGNRDAIALVADFYRIADVWDNLIDKDAAVSDRQINEAFYAALIGIQANPFMRQHFDQLNPVMAAGITNWIIANRMEGMTEAAVDIAHTLRYSVADVFVTAARLLGGLFWAEEVGPELRLRCQRDTLTHYKGELAERRRKHEQV